MPDGSSKATIVLYDGAGQQMTQALDVLLDVRNNFDAEKSVWVKGPVIQLDLEFHDGPGDNYVVNVWAKGYRGTGDFVKADPMVHAVLKLLMIPVPTKVMFRGWDELKAKYPKAAGLLGLGVNGDAAQDAACIEGSGTHCVLKQVGVDVVGTTNGGRSSAPFTQLD